MCKDVAYQLTRQHLICAHENAHEPPLCFCASVLPYPMVYQLACARRQRGPPEQEDSRTSAPRHQGTPTPSPLLHLQPQHPRAMMAATRPPPAADTHHWEGGGVSASALAGAAGMGTRRSPSSSPRGRPWCYSDGRQAAAPGATGTDGGQYSSTAADGSIRADYELVSRV